jgi:hypothetical protein
VDTHRALPSQTLRIDEVAALPSPQVVLSCRLKRYYCRIRRPPGQRRVSRDHRLSSASLPATTLPQVAGPGRASPVPAATICTFRAPYAGESFSTCTSRSSAPSMAFALYSGARHSLFPPNRTDTLTTPQASRHATDRTVAPPIRAFDTGLRRRTFPSDAASLLPGRLAATRTGLTPASDDELTTQDDLHGHLQSAGHTNEPV